ncbi:MAG: hypothetical protein M3Y80_05645, partial [Verrucomicrobiota bacterium]|nr:hypothetical protein [Verrucomicrobiota bacterium]
SQNLSIEELSTYLNDHLAGAAGALELIEHLASKHAESELGSFFAELHAEVTADRDVVRDLLNTFEAKEGTMRKAGAWVAEKFARAKLQLTEQEASGVGFLEALDGLVLGITGKALLWRALAAAAETVPQLSGPDYAKLEQRAMAQRDAVDEKRISAARSAFIAPAG